MSAFNILIDFQLILYNYKHILYTFAVKILMLWQKTTILWFLMV